MTILELLSAATRARVVAADALASIADWLDRLVVGGRIGVGPLRLIGRLSGNAARRLVRRRGNLPQRPDEARAFLLEPEDRTGDLLGNPLPHAFEGLHPLALVLDFRVFLGVSHQANPLAEVVHVIEVVFPGLVENFQNECPLSLAELG